jgi:hypothetical protein
MFKKSCENPERIYIPFLGVRLVFDLSLAKGHRYVGWYRP